MARAQRRRRAGTPKAESKPRKPAKGGSALVRWARRIFVGLLALALIGAGGVAGVFFYFGRDLPDVDSLHDYHPAQVTRILDRNGEVLGES